VENKEINSVIKIIKLMDEQIEQTKQARAEIIKIWNLCIICASKEADSTCDKTLCEGCMDMMAKGYNGKGGW